jgi:hypothetical protein
MAPWFSPFKAGRAENPPVLIPATQVAGATQPARRVDMHLTIASKDPIVRVVAVDRALADPLAITKDSPQTPTKDPFVYVAHADPKPGGGSGVGAAFTVPNLLSGQHYDLIVWTQPAGLAAGANSALCRWEGCAMDYHRPIVPDQPASDEDTKWLKEFVATEPQFANKARVLWMAADHRHATLLVELIRDTEFHSGGSGEIIYRVELWYFENLFGGWAKDKNTERVLARWRGPGETFPPALLGGHGGGWQFVPALGGVEPSADPGGSPLKLALPEKPDPRRGVLGKP